MDKVLFIIFEGVSDRVTLYLPTKNFIEKKKINVQPYVTRGDIALAPGATFESCLKTLEGIVKDFKRNYYLSPNDFFGIFHIVDTDGSFLENDAYVLTESETKYDEKNGIIFSKYVQSIRERNEKKKDLERKRYFENIRRFANKYSEEETKRILIDRMAENLVVLRAKLGLTQADLAEIAGLSRQTVLALEKKQRAMTWNTFLSLLFIFYLNKETCALLSVLDILTDELKEYITEYKNSK